MESEGFLPRKSERFWIQKFHELHFKYNPTKNHPGQAGTKNDFCLLIFRLSGNSKFETRAKHLDGDKLETNPKSECSNYQNYSGILFHPGHDPVIVRNLYLLKHCRVLPKIRINCYRTRQLQNLGSIKS